jgi:putative nucleotidyltransferase with HDIG domain
MDGFAMNNDTTIRLIDGNAKRRRALAAFLEKRGVSVDAAETLPAPSEPASSGEPEILVVSVPGSRGASLAAIKKLKRARPSIAVIVLAAANASEAVLPFLDDGLVEQIVSPGSPAGVYSAIRAERRKTALLRLTAAFREVLRRMKKEHASDVRRTGEIEERYETTLENFMTALDLRDVETYGHSKTVARYSHVLARALGIRDPKTLDNIRKGALLHDAGKIAIPDSILKKPGPLTAGEWEKLKRHPVLGYGLVKDVKLVKEVRNIIICHHEKYDGTGYPSGLKETRIPLEARIFSVVDTLDAITSHRPYRAPQDFASARDEIIRHSGTQFDPRVVDAFCSLDVSVWEKIRFETTRLLPAAVDGTLSPMKG